VSTVVALHRSPVHAFSKQAEETLTFIAGEGIEGDAHRGVTVKHRSRVKADPTQPNLRQVHLLPVELFEELAAKGHAVQPGDLGENVTTRGIDLPGLPRGTILKLGAEVRIEVTGLRNPCSQIEAFQSGLLDEVLERTAEGGLIRKAGIMGIILKGGIVRINDAVGVTLPMEPHVPLERV
jgi:MOSC domain-containing protein YiiM